MRAKGRGSHTLSLPIDMTRRRFLAGSLALGATGSQAFAGDVAQRVISLDYGLATTILALGGTPVGVASAADWDVWVVEPELPTSVVDIGDDLAVNLEVMAALKPDLILSTPYLSGLESYLGRIAPVLTLRIYGQGGGPLERSRKATRILAERLDRQEEARAYLAEAERFFDQCAERVAALPPNDVAFVNFMDARHARVFAKHSLYQDVLDRIGLANAWSGPTNFWGFQTVPLEELGQLSGERVRLIAFEPVPPDVLPTLEKSPLWTQLPFVKAGRVSTLPGVLMFGMIPSALRFASLVVDHLERLEA